MAQQVHQSVDEVISFALERLATRLVRERRAQTLREVREEVYRMSYRDPLGTKLEDKRSFSYYFLESRNRKRINEFVHTHRTMRPCDLQ